MFDPECDKDAGNDGVMWVIMLFVVSCVLVPLLYIICKTRQVGKLFTPEVVCTIAYVVSSLLVIWLLVHLAS